MNLFLCGDIHGDINPIKNFYRNYIKDTPGEKEENWLIMLGDFGANYYFDYRDRNFKRELSKYPFKYFVIRGNHEQRTSLCAVRDDNWVSDRLFDGPVMYEQQYPTIFYAADEGGIYNIAGRKTLVIPGAYSVDKYYRLQRGWSWFVDEQLAPHEMLNLTLEAENQHFDLVLSHTCPYRYRPTDLFLSCIDQSQVDNTMELWMDGLHDKIEFNLWCWGHYHADRIEAPYCEMFMHEIEPLNQVEARWQVYRETGELAWWIPKSPNFYMWTKEEN